MAKLWPRFARDRWQSGERSCGLASENFCLAWGPACCGAFQFWAGSGRDPEHQRHSLRVRWQTRSVPEVLCLGGTAPVVFPSKAILAMCKKTQKKKKATRSPTGSAVTDRPTPFRQRGPRTNIMLRVIPYHDTMQTLQILQLSICVLLINGARLFRIC